MKTTLKRSSFLMKSLLVSVTTILILALVYTLSFWGSDNQAQANVAYFYPANCLGGWKNVDKISGQPEIKSSKDGAYDDSNSGSIFNSNAQLFCGSFDGEIPFAVENQKVSLNFSWHIEDDDPSNDFFVEDKIEDSDVSDTETNIEVIDDNNKDTEVTVPENISSEENSQNLEKVENEISDVENKSENSAVEESSEQPKEEAKAEPEPPKEEVNNSEEPVSAEPVSFNFFNNLFAVAHAEELISEAAPEVENVVEEVVGTEVDKEEKIIEEEMVTDSDSEILNTESSSTQSVEESKGEEVDEVEESENDVVAGKEEVIIESNPAEGAYFEVLYTLDGQNWHSLGYISRIANDVQIEMPIDLFSSVENLNKVQIALHTVERFDSVPKIYLDSLWLEIVYDYSDEAGLVPPGFKSGDVIFSEVKYDDYSAVVVLRNVELITLSNVLSAATASSSNEVINDGVASTSSSTDNSIEDKIATTTASSTPEQAEKTLTQIVATTTLSEIINSTGVTVELWLFASSSNSWSRVADDSIISRNPQTKFESGNIFWVDKNNASVWRYNISSGGYDSLSLSSGEVSGLQFRDEAGELKQLEFSSGTSTLLMQEVKRVETISP